LRLLKNKKAEDAGDLTTLPNEGMVEVLLAGMLIVFSAIFIAHVLEDLTPYHIYYSKDVSIFQDAFLLIPGNSYFRYDNTEGKMNLLDFELSPFYTTTLSSGDQKKEKTTNEIARSYIHLENPRTVNQPLQNFGNPSALYFLRTNNDFSVSEDYIGFDQAHIACKSAASPDDFDPNEPYYLSYNTLVFDEVVFDTFLESLNEGLSTPKYFSSTTYSSLDAFRRNQIPADMIGKPYAVFIGFTKAQSDRTIKIYAPFCKKKDVACSIYNALISKEEALGLEISHIPTESFADIDELQQFSDFMYIEMSEKNQYLVLNTVKEVIKG